MLRIITEYNLIKSLQDYFSFAALEMFLEHRTIHRDRVHSSPMPKVRRKTTIKRRRRKKQQIDALNLDLEPHTRHQVKGIIAIGFGLVLFLALGNDAGVLGFTINRALTFFFGSWNVLFPSSLVLLGCLLMIGSSPNLETKRTLGITFCLSAFLGLMHLIAPVQDMATHRDELAGAVGLDRKSTRLNSSHVSESRMPSSA